MANTLHFSATLQAAASPVFSERTNKRHCQSLRVQTGNYNSVAACLAQSRSSRVLKVSCEAASVDVLEMSITNNQAEKQLTCVMKFGGSSLASAERMREVAELILSFPNESPVIVLSAMGKTTNKLLLVWLLSLCFLCPFFFRGGGGKKELFNGQLNYIGWRKGC